MAYCANHPETVAAAYCRTCGKPLCDNCKRDVRGVIYCEECIATRISGEHAAATPGAVPPIPPAAPVSGGPNPVLAAILGFLFPGVGAMYNGQFVKALAHVAIFVFLIKLADETNGLFGIGIAAWVFYMAFDAYHTAKARQMGLPAPDFLGLNRMFGVRDEAPVAGAAYAGAPGTVEPAPEEQKGIPAGALWLIGLGVFFLLANMNIFDLRIGRFLWEFVVIGLGVYLLVGRWTGTRHTRGVYCRCARCRSRYITGPIMMITVGVLGLLNASYVLRFRNSWPLFLIVLGAIRMVQMSASTEGHTDFIPAPPPAAPPTTAVTTTTTTNTEVNNG